MVNNDNVDYMDNIWTYWSLIQQAFNKPTLIGITTLVTIAIMDNQFVLLLIQDWAAWIRDYWVVNNMNTLVVSWFVNQLATQFVITCIISLISSITMYHQYQSLSTIIAMIILFLASASNGFARTCSVTIGLTSAQVTRGCRTASIMSSW